MGDGILRILMLTPSASRAGGGVSVAVRNLARLMASEPNLTIQVAAIADAPLASGEADEWAGIAVSRHRVYGPKSYGFAPGLLRAAVASEADVIHVHGVWQFQCVAALLANLLRGTPILITPHGMLESWILANSRRLKRMVGLLYQNRFLRRARRFHILTVKERHDVEQMTPGASCRLIPNAVETSAPASVLPGWWEPHLEGRAIYLFFGRLHRKKGCVELCDAWEMLCAQDEGFRERSALVFCGPSDGIPGFVERVAALNVRFGNVIMAGPQFGEGKLQSLSAASFLCLPSHSEGLPITVLEAWAAGVPVIMTPECNLPIGFDRGAAIKTGTTPSDIIHSLHHASQLSDERRIGMVSAGSEIIREFFAPEVVRSAWKALYCDMRT